MQRIVLDTSVIVTALRSRTGAGFALVRAARHRQVTLLATSALFFEYEDVLKRDTQREVSGLTLDDVDRFLGALAILIEPVDVHMRWRPQLRDPDDEMVLEAALNDRPADAGRLIAGLMASPFSWRAGSHTVDPGCLCREQGRLRGQH